MAKTTAGYLEYRDQFYRLRDARAEFDDELLTIQASGKRIGLELEGIPFYGVRDVGDLPGEEWNPDADEIAELADVFLEGGLIIGQERFEVIACRIACRRFNAEDNYLTLEVMFEVRSECGREDVIEGVLCCEVEYSEEPRILLFPVA